jgi:DNA-binding CsgD family transcriptional regulator/tetratricopeptide (TPR) repeat protein
VDWSGDISDREAEVLAFLGEHRSNAQIAKQMHISVRTVESHVSSLLRKLGVSDRRALAAFAGRAGAALEEPSRNFLPRDVPDFTDRVDVVRLLANDPSPGQIDVINGMAGVGKTALAVHVGHRLAGRFPDGQFYIDLYGYTPGRHPLEPVAALRTLLTAAGVAPAAIPDEEAGAAGRWRSEMAGRRAVVVLDNATDASQVRPLLPGTASCRVIVTSRQQLVDLDGVRPVSLDVLSAQEAAVLFHRAWGNPAAPAPDPAGPAGPAGPVVRACGCLPLAVRIAAARLRHRPQWTVDHLAELLQDERRRLATLEAAERGVASAFGVSYRRLDGVHGRLFRLLGLVPGGEVDRYAAAALADLDVEVAEVALEDLVDTYLVEQPKAGRYRQHDLLREYARQLLADIDQTAQREAALDRLLDYYLQAATRACTQLPAQTPSSAAAEGMPRAALPPLADPDQALDWLDAEDANLVAVTRQAAATGRDAYAATLPQILGGYFQLRGRISDCTTMVEAGLAAAERLGDVAAQARLLCTLAWVLAYAGERAPATTELIRALHLARQAGDRRAEAIALHTLGFSSFHWGEHAAALPWYEQAAALRREHGRTAGNASAIAGLGLVEAMLGRYDDAEQHAREALAIAESAAESSTGPLSLLVLGLVAHRRDRHAEALDHLHHALSDLRATGHLIGQTDVLRQLAEVYTDTGDLVAAQDYLDQATETDARLALPAPDHHLVNARGRLHLAGGRTADALSCYQDALALALILGDHYGEAHARTGIANALRTTDPHTARAEQSRARALFTHLGVPEANHAAW